MNWLSAVLKSSVGRKFLMGITGLFLCFFLVVHLAGNLLLFAGQEIYDEYAHKLHSNGELLIVAEILLFSAFAVHILYAISLTLTNKEAREQGYAVQRSKVPGRAFNILGLTPDNTMVITGLVVFLFLTVHLSDFKFEWAWGDQLEGIEPYAKAQLILADAGRVVIYVVGALFLGIHVAHGFASAFQSLGLNHPKYTPTIKSLSRVFGFVVAIGFGCIPVIFPKLMQAEPEHEYVEMMEISEHTLVPDESASPAQDDAHGNSPEHAAPNAVEDAATPAESTTPPVPPTSQPAETSTTN
ncbi:MAG: succinate dehydrogenase cytochrome b subunit [Planctomycetaceae bacterium]|nr:succinate dehydrogenase cytochrome b subunit [Planctomycetaceae bacterium]